MVSNILQHVREMPKRPMIISVNWMIKINKWDWYLHMMLQILVPVQHLSLLLVNHGIGHAMLISYVMRVHLYILHKPANGYCNTIIQYIEDVDDKIDIIL